MSLTGALRPRVGLSTLLVALGVTAAGCSGGAPPPGASTVLNPPITGVSVKDATTTGRDWVTAVPDKAASKAAGAAVTITWAAPGAPLAQVRVAIDGGAEKALYGGTQFGSARASWIEPGQSYTFRLYRSPSAHTVVASIVVEGGLG